MGLVDDTRVEPAPATRARPAAQAPAPARRSGRAGKILMGLLWAAVIASLASIWWRFGSLDPDRGRLSPDEHPWFYPVLMVHIAGSSVALVTSVLQVWPWMRKNHRRFHRNSGRVYVASIHVAGWSALVLTLVWPWTPLTAYSDVLTSFLWIGITTYGWMLARQRRYADHRRWMLRSFALTATVLTNQLIGLPLLMLVKPHLHTTFGGNEEFMLQVWAGLDVWLGWTLSLLAVEWYLEREQLRRSARRQRVERPEPAVAS